MTDGMTANRTPQVKSARPADAVPDPIRRALVVEDRPEIVATVTRLLEREGFSVEIAYDGETAVETARAFNPELIVLDLSLPKRDGIEVCREVRTFSDAYVIMVTGRTDEIDVLVGLGVGADDYVRKPFSPRELQARIRVMARRPRQRTSLTEERTFGDLVVVPAAHEVRLSGKVVPLTKTEFDLLEVLSSNPRISFTRAMLVERVWGGSWYGDTHLVDVHIANLRKKLGDEPGAPRYIRTVRGVGYRMATS
jgi:DNA-binding response OmpR family regulator